MTRCIASSVTLYGTVRRRARYDYLIFILLCWPFFWAYSATGLRQSLALSISLLAIAALIRERLYIASGLIFLATLFHAATILLAIVFLPLWRILETEWIIAFWIFSIIFGLSVNLQGLEYLIPHQMNLQSRFSHYLSEDFGLDVTRGIRVDFVFFSAIPIVAFFLRQKNKLTDERRLEVLFKLYIILNSIGNILSTVPYSDRIYSFSWLIAPIVLASVWEGLPQMMRIGISSFLLYLVYTYSGHWIGL